MLVHVECGPSRYVGTLMAVMPSSPRPWLRRIARGCRLLQCEQQFWRGSHLHSKTQIYAARTQLLLRPLTFGSSALPSASAIEVCARSAAKVSFLQACSACPEGGLCAGKLSPPIAKRDWWGIDGGTLFTSCQTDGRCVGSTNCSQVSTHARTGKDGQAGGMAWL